jgi:hypothetical protein
LRPQPFLHGRRIVCTGIIASNDCRKAFPEEDRWLALLGTNNSGIAFRRLRRMINMEFLPAVLVWRTESTHIIGAHTCRILSDFFTTTYVRDLHSQTTRCACHYTDNFVCIMLCLGFLQPNLRVLQSQTTVISVPATRHIISSNLCGL